MNTTPNSTHMPNLTPTPWNLHRYYDGKPMLVSPSEGEPWVAGELLIACEDKIIGKVEFSTHSGGWPTLRTEAEMRAHADFILRAVNSHANLVESVKRLLPAVECAVSLLPQAGGDKAAQDRLELSCASARADLFTVTTH